MIEGIVRGKRAAPRRVLLYGTHGIGKSTWAAAAPKPIVLATEDGLNDVGVDRIEFYGRETIDLAKALIALSGEENHGYKTVVIDSLDWLEKMIWAATVKEHGKKSIEDFPFGRGYTLAAKRWESLIVMLEACRARGINCVLLAHAKIERFTPPDSDAYDRYVPDLHKVASALVQEWVDEVLFASYRVSTISKDEGFGQNRTRAIGSGERVVHTCEMPTHAAKRRIVLPDVLPLEWAAYQAAWPTNGQATGDIAGMVVEGHSKQKGTK